MTQEERKIYNKKYRELNKAKEMLYNKEYHEKHKKKASDRKKKNHIENPNQRKDNMDNWRKLNRDHEKSYKKNKLKTNPVFKVSCAIRTLIHTKLKQGSYTKKSKTYEILGCSFDEFKNHLEKQFEPWMNWNNHGLYKSKIFNYGWDIDHRVPTSSAKTEEELLKLNHFTNLQPLCSYTNRVIKRDNI